MRLFGGQIGPEGVRELQKLAENEQFDYNSSEPSKEPVRGKRVEQKDGDGGGNDKKRKSKGAKIEKRNSRSHAERKRARQETAPISGREGEETSVSIATRPDAAA